MNGDNTNNFIVVLLIVIVAVFLIVGIILIQTHKTFEVYNTYKTDNITTYVQPDYKADCIKWEDPKTGEFGMQCDKVKK